MRRHWKLLVSIGIVLLILVLAGAVALRGGGAHQASLRGAEQRFAESSSTLAPQRDVLRPGAGVYTYVGSGSENISSPPKSQGQGPKMPATVTHQANGCWTLRIDYSTHHWQSILYCPRGSGLYETGGQTFEQFDFVFAKVNTTSTLACTPANPTVLPNMKVGQVWQQSCSGTSTGIKGRMTSAGPFTFVGEETLDIGGTKVAAFHFHQARTLSGAQTGTQDADWWYDTTDGMLLRNRHSYVVKSDSPIGKITYTENAQLQLTSLVATR
jgi:hypothetical protein